MVRRGLAVASLVLVLVSVGVVLRASNSPDGLAVATGVWGFVLSAAGLVLGALSLWPVVAERRRRDTQNVQVIEAHNGDAFGVQNGSQHVDRKPGNSTDAGN